MRLPVYIARELVSRIVINAAIVAWRQCDSADPYTAQYWRAECDRIIDAGNLHSMLDDRGLDAWLHENVTLVNRWIEWTQYTPEIPYYDRYDCPYGFIWPGARGDASGDDHAATEGAQDTLFDLDNY